MEVRIVIIKTDSFTSKQHLLFSLENELITEGFFPPKIRAMTRMTILAFPSPVSPTYELVVIMDLPDYIFIDPGQSLILKIDGKMVALSSRDGSTQYREPRNEMGMITELAAYDLTYEDILSVATAKSVEYRLRGNKGSFDYHFKDKALEEFRSLVKIIPEKGAPWKIVGDTVVVDISDVTDKAKDPIDSSNKFDLATELAKFDKLKKDGLITAEDYEVLKKRAIEKAKE